MLLNFLDQLFDVDYFSVRGSNMEQVKDDSEVGIWCDVHGGFFVSEVYHMIDGEVICPSCFAKSLIEVMEEKMLPEVEPDQLLKMIKDVSKRLNALMEDVEMLCRLNRKMKRGRK